MYKYRKSLLKSYDVVLVYEHVDFMNTFLEILCIFKYNTLVQKLKTTITFIFMNIRDIHKNARKHSRYM